eukprot:Clim_evm8s215 gene=Clim_evmTU8s215
MSVLAPLGNLLVSILLSIQHYLAMMYDAFMNWLNPRRQLRLQFIQEMNEARDYGEWYAAALECDELEGNNNWKLDPRSSYYDAELIASRLRHLQAAREEEDIDTMAFLLRHDLVRGLGGIGHPKLYQKCYVGTKKLIEAYVAEVVTHLCFIRDGDFPGFSLRQKEMFFRDTRQAFGRTALLLSGGSTLGMYHFGVVKALYRFNLLPRVISGSSIGALVVALLGVHTDDEMPRLFESNAIDFSAFDRLGKGSARRKIARFLKHGVLNDIRKLEGFCRGNIGDLTFQEAYNRTGRIVNITVASTITHEMPWLLNYLTAPNVLMWSAALASCASPGLYEPVTIMCKDHTGRIVPWQPSTHKWSDASLENDLPMARLSELFNINHFVVSQVNPHVVPFLHNTRKTIDGFGLMHGFRTIFLSELHHRVMQMAELGLFPKILAWLQPIISQKYEGDITVVPDVSVTDIAAFLSNPNQDMLAHAIAVGERSTWPYISIIRTRCKIEVTLDTCIKFVRQRSKQRTMSSTEEDDTLVDKNTLPRRRSYGESITKTSMVI